MSWPSILQSFNATPSDSWRAMRLSSLQRKFMESSIDHNQLLDLREEWSSEMPFFDANGNPFVLYIYDQAVAYQNPRFNRGEDHGYKFHFCWCKTLENMRQIGRQARYKAKHDVDNNMFTVYRGQEDEKIEMRVCKNCLNCFSYKNYSTISRERKNAIYHEFDISTFFEKNDCPALPRPTHPHHTGRYPKDWPQIAQRIKQERGNRCEVIGCNEMSCLDVHHINGLKDDGNENDPDNLIVLCRKHHIQQPQHGHMRNLQTVRV